MKTYAGIGSRGTPERVLQYMTKIAFRLNELGWTLNSGGAPGADLAFALGAKRPNIFLPWPGFNGQNGIVATSSEAMELAAQYHPAWNKLSTGARKLMARNCHQILGADLHTPVDFVLCWTPDGAETSTSIKTGGTGQAIRIAIDQGIPVFNLRNSDALTRLKLIL